MIAIVEARRLLHACYCCADADVVVAFHEKALGLHEKMRTAPGRSDGAPLGLSGEMLTQIMFLYDERGGRTSPAVEVQAWIDPPVIGVPYTEPWEVGVQSLGIAVPDVSIAAGRAEGLGGTIVGRSDDGLFDEPVVQVRDPLGVAIDLVERPSLSATSQFVHVRITCRDLSASVEWYQASGFQTVKERRSIGPVDACHLQLPDEPLQLVLTQWLDPPSTGVAYPQANHQGLYRLAVAFDDTRAAYELLRKAGWEWTGPPELIELDGRPVPDMWVAFTRDPDGIPIEMVQRPRSFFR
jgi:catechol 2,3-dioxygenase-like lactoylglutathione lyase family enzyme